MDEVSTFMTKTPSNRPKRGHVAGIGLCVVLLFVVILVKMNGRAGGNSTPLVSIATDIGTRSDEPQAAAPVSQLVGRWRDRYYGERTLTFKPDGSGSMVILLDSIGQAIYGKSLSFDLTWKDEDGVLVFKFLGGEPASAVKTICQQWGDTHRQKIELLTKADLHLQSSNSATVYQLKRLAD